MKTGHDSSRILKFMESRICKLKKLGVGIIGVGAIGRLHAENLAKNIPNVTLVGIADSNVVPQRKWETN